MFFYYIHTASYHHIPGSAIMYNADSKENTEGEENVQRTYNILLCGILAVVTSAVRGTTSSPVVHVRCSSYLNIHLLV